MRLLSFSGVGACLLMVILSGASVTYFELILKPIQNGNSNVRTLTIWERNFQLALFSVFLSVAFAIVAEVVSGNLSFSDLSSFRCSFIKL